MILLIARNLKLMVETDDRVWEVCIIIYVSRSNILLAKLFLEQRIFRKWALGT